MIQRSAAGNQDRYKKQRLFAPLGPEGDERLRRSSVLLVGCGALGSNVAVQLVRAGVGHIRLVDRDVVDWTNLHRQVEYDESDAEDAAPKAVALKRHLTAANRSVEVESVVEDFNFRNAEVLAQSVDLVVDGSDNLPTRYLINDVSLALRLPWVYGGAVGEDARAQLFVPGAGPCLRCTFPDLPPPGALPTCDTAGVLGPAAAAAASYQASLALHCLARPEDCSELSGQLVRLTLWTPSATISRVESAPSCPACQLGDRDFLSGRCAEEATVLCGQGAVQILPAAGAAALDLELLEKRLLTAGNVVRRPYLLRFSPTDTDTTITIFRDRRAIVEGTRDVTVARTLYDRYIGQ